MTKINKLGKSTFVIAILSFILVAVLAFGGTYAYFSATATADSASITVGHLRIDKDTAFNDTEIAKIGVAVPNQPIITADNGAVTVDVDSNINYFIRAKVTYDYTLTTEGCQKVAVGATNATCGHADAGIELLIIDTTKSTVSDPEDTANAGSWISGLTSVSDEQADDGLVVETNANGTGWYYYSTAWAPKAAATAGAGKNVRTHTFNLEAKVNPLAGQVESEHFMDATITITVQFEVIQADYIIDAGTAPAGTTVYNAEQLQAAWNLADKAIGA